MLNTILSYIVTAILNWMAKRVTKEVTAKLEQVQKDEARQETNHENVKAYKAAQTRAEQIEAATRLLNRTRP